MANFEACYEKVILIEGGYRLTEVKGDRGGMTYAGIARKIWPKWEGWDKIDAGEFDAELTGMVRTFYRKEFWDRILGDDIGAQAVAYHIYAFAVNAGLKTSIRICQRIIGATPDGIFGDKTFRKLDGAIQDEKDVRIFTTTFSLLKIFRYKNICMNDVRRKYDQVESDQKFLCGWINRVQEGFI
ncbi:glycosyl hydrolase 108 family protein [Desulfobacula sp.]|uniref:glycosyl hydrolase 108 family protein n=1 Tax=Desulfobacula sp. TaxID=2593537 RepID=UPI0026244F29|nr:glycosyl hydrolase 108 family protein [Desulfobacula sp.]